MAPRQYEYTPEFLWSNTVHQAASACSDYFEWNEFLTGGGNDHAEGGWSDRDYYGIALACSTGILNRTPYAYAAAWGMPRRAGRHRQAVCDESNVGTLDVVLAQADPFINDHLLSMAGLPDLAGDVRRIVNEVMDVFEDILAYVLMPFNPLREGLADLKQWVKDIIVDAIASVIGIDIEALGSFLKEPSRWVCLDQAPFTFPPPLGAATLPLFPEGFHDRLDGILGLPPGHHVSEQGLAEDCGRMTDGTAFDPEVFAPMGNTVTMAKLLLLDGSQVNQVLSDVLGRTVETYGLTDRETGRSRGFGFIEMDDADAENAIAQLNGREFGQRTLRVNEAEDRGGERRGPGGGGGGGRGGRDRW